MPRAEDTGQGTECAVTRSPAILLLLLLMASTSTPQGLDSPHRPGACEEGWDDLN